MTETAGPERSGPDLAEERLLSAIWDIGYLRVRHEPFLDRHLTAYRGDARPRILNRTGVIVTETLCAGKPLREAVDRLERRYPGLDRGKLTSDALAFIRRLAERGGVVPRDEKGGPAAAGSADLAGRCSFREVPRPADVANCFMIPDRVQIEVTKRCNLRCQHCYVPGAAGQNEDELTTEALFALIDRFDKWGVFTLEISGGEPLLRPDLRELVEHAAERRLAVVLYTNATLLRPILDRAFVSRINCFAISVDGPEAHHDAVRKGKGAFAETARAIQEVASLGGRVSVSYTLSPENLAYVEDVRRQVHDLGAVRFVCSPPTPFGRGRELDLSLDDYRRLSKCALTQGEARHGVSGVQSPLLPREFTCAAGKDFFFIASDGRLYPCPFFSTEDFDFGDSRTENFEETWLTAPVLKRFRAVRPSSDPRCVCKSCPMWCRALHYHLTGQLEGDPTAYCPRLGA